MTIMRDVGFSHPLRTYRTPSLLAALILMVVLAIVYAKLLFSAHDESEAMALTPGIVEATYPELFEYAKGVAKQGNASADEALHWNRILPPEVLGIEVGRYTGYISLANRVLSKHSGRMWLARKPEINMPVLNQFEYAEGGQGGKITVIVYESLIPLPNGPPRELNVCIDSGGLHEAIERKLKDLSKPKVQHKVQ